MNLDHFFHKRYSAKYFVRNVATVTLLSGQIHVERIYPDEKFWCQNVPKAKHFFTTAILPELLGRFYSRIQQVPSNKRARTPISDSESSSAWQSSPSAQQTYCYCNGLDEGHMVGCDNPGCAYKWFHLDCLGLKSHPTSKKWFCPECRKLPDFQVKKKRRTAIKVDINYNFF